MNCVLIYRDLAKNETDHVKELYTKGAVVLISPLQATPPELNQIKIDAIFLEEKEKNRIANSVKDDLLKYGNKILNGKSVTDWLSVQKTSLWYYHKHRIYLQIRNYVYTLHEINKYSEKHKQTHVFSHTEFPDLDPKSTILHHQKRERKGIPLRALIYFFFSVIWKASIGLFHWINQGQIKHVIITNQKALGRYLNLKTLEEDIEDIFLGYLRQQTDHSFMHIEDIQIPKPGAFQPKIKRKPTYTYPTLSAEYILITRLINFGNIYHLASKHRQLKPIYQLLLKNEETEIDNLITNMLIKLHRSSLFYIYKLLAFQSYFANKNYKTITAKDENSSSAKIILDAAKYHGITTLGIQHGAVSELNINYMFTKEDEKYHPMPDHTLVWGENWRSILINCGAYPNDSVLTIGQIRSDVIPKLKENKPAPFLTEQNKYDNTLVFASQPQPDPVLRRQSAEDVFKATSNLENTLLIIKLHPRENDLTYYDNIAKNIGCTNYVIEKEMDLYKVIAACDGLITCYSTVGGEAVYFDKPLVILDHLKLDYCGYYKEGVAKRATNAAELENILLEMISNNFTIDSAIYNSFKKKYAFKIDGNVSKRCLDFIKGLE